MIRLIVSAFFSRFRTSRKDSQQAGMTLSWILLNIFLVIISLLMVSCLYASQSTIAESEGYACMGEDKSKKQTEQAVLVDANKKAIEQVSTYLKSETHVKNFEFEKDLTSAYSNTTVKVIQEIEKRWYKDSSAGDCYKIKAEVIPDEKAIEKVSE